MKRLFEIEKEEWRDIQGYEGLYQVSNLGNVKKLNFTYIDTWGTGRKRTILEHFVKANIGKMGYYMIDLRFKNNRKRCYVHRLVAQAFIPNPNNYPCVNHKDENPLNNNVNNLEWCTYAYNNSYGTSRQRMVKTRRYKNNYVISEQVRKKISNALKGKKKSALHKKHISEGRKLMFSNQKGVIR